MQTLLSFYDRDMSGSIMLADLRTMLQNAGERMTGQEVDNLLFGLEDTDGKIGAETLVKHIMSL